MKCKICNSESKPQFAALVLGKYNVTYYQCTRCRFIQTETPFWLSEAYQEAITDLDLGYATRNIALAEFVSHTIRFTMKRRGAFIDYGGGYGLFVRLLRDRGYNFYRQDRYCKNIFALNYDVSDLKTPQKFEMLTAFEVFEHLDDPIGEIEKMFTYSESLLFSTALVPERGISAPEDWWYIAPETGQHVAFYSKASLQHLATLFECNLYSDGNGLHLLTKKKYVLNPVMAIAHLHSLFNRIFSRHFNNRKSLISKDSQAAKQMLSQKADMKGMAAIS